MSNTAPIQNSEHPLSSIKLFENLSTDTLDLLLEASQTKDYPKHQVLIREGAKSTGLQCLISGEVKVYLSDEDGKELVLKTLQPGESFGELGLLDGAPHTASIITTKPSSIISVNRGNFYDLLNSHPELNQALINNLTSMVRNLTEQVKSLGLKDVYGRVRAFLQEHCETDLPSKEKITQQGIALRIGSSREMVARILKELTVGGYIKTEKKHITLLKTLPEHY